MSRALRPAPYVLMDASDEVDVFRHLLEQEAAVAQPREGVREARLLELIVRGQQLGVAIFELERALAHFALEASAVLRFARELALLSPEHAEHE